MSKITSKPNKKANTPNFSQISFKTEPPFKDLTITHNNAIIFDSRQNLSENLNEYIFDLEISKSKEDKNINWYWLFVNFPNDQGEYFEGNGLSKELFGRFIAFEKKIPIAIGIYLTYLEPKYQWAFSVRQYPKNLKTFVPYLVDIETQNLEVCFRDNSIFLKIPKDEKISFKYNQTLNSEPIQLHKENIGDDRYYFNILPRKD